MYQKGCRLSVTLFAFTLLLGLSTLPANAQFSWTNWVAPVGESSQMYGDMMRMLYNNFNAGIIGSSELASYKADLDGIMVARESERERKTRDSLVEAHAIKRMKRLQEFYNISVEVRARK